jgi:serine/threonine protein kinase
MELCDSNLAGFLESPLPWFVDLPKTVFNTIVNWIIDLTSALQAFHALGAVHWDIKPQNIWIKGQHIYLADFGLASQDPKLSQQASSVSGTERYKAPEMAMGETYTRKSDISLGCVILEMLTLLNKLRLNFFSDFRQTWGKQGCHHSEHPCFCHNLEAVHFFGEKFFKKTPGVDYYLSMRLSKYFRITKIPSFISRCLRWPSERSIANSRIHEE